MGTVFFDVGTSLDGFIAGPNGGPENPLGDGGTRIHEWVYGLASWRERVGLSGGATTADDALVRRVIARAGAFVMGRRMFDEGELSWPANPPFRAPVFVVTHQPREPWVREGGTTFHFVTEGIEAALDLAREAAVDRDVRVAGGADTIQRFLDAGLIDDFTIHIAPVLLGAGVRLFERFDAERVTVEMTAATHSPLVTHIDYRVVR